MSSAGTSETILEMIAFRHIRFRRRESYPRRAWKMVVRVVVDVIAATVIARRFLRHRPTLLHR
jgi:hypothetical protein